MRSAQGRCGLPEIESVIPKTVVVQRLSYAEETAKTAINEGLNPGAGSCTGAPRNVEPNPGVLYSMRSSPIRMVYKSPLRKALLTGMFGAAAVAAGQVGCSSNGLTPSEPSPSSPSSTEGTGSVGMQLTLPGGEQLNTISWTLTGPNGASTVVQTGSVNVQNSQTASFIVGGIPGGSGYSIALSGTSTDGSVTCSGSATFSVTPRQTTNVSVLLQCSSGASEAGAVLVNGNTFNCATWSGVTANPAETTVGNSVLVTGSATGPNPSGLTYSWTATSGTFDTPNAASTHFTCAAQGAATLTLTVGDGPVPDGGACGTASVTTVQVQCDGHLDAAAQLTTATKIKHLVVIFGENISYDHYFGTYPQAQNNPGETPFVAAAGTPTGNSLATPLDPTHSFAPVVGVNLLTNNPNSTNAGNGTGAANPYRLGAGQAATADQGHNYKPEQQAEDNGAMDLFPEFTGTAGPPPDAGAASSTKGLVMAYYDGNTVNTMWNLAQTYALNDNSWSTVFGPSTLVRST